MRRPGEEPLPEPAPHESSHEEAHLSGAAADTHDAEAEPAVATRRWAPRLIAAMLLLLVATGAAAWLFLSRPPDEGKLWQTIVTDIDQGKVLDAAKSIKKLREAFPDSQKKDLHKLYADLIQVRILDSDISPDLSAAADKMGALLNDHENDPILTESEHTDRVWKTCHQLIDQFIEAAKAVPPVSPENRTRTRQLLGQARQLLDEAKKRIKRKLPDDQLLALEAKMQGVEVAIARAEEVEHALAEVGQYPPKMSNLDKILTLLKKHHLQDDPRGQALVEDFKGKLIAGVTFTPAQAVKPPRPVAEEPSLLVAPDRPPGFQHGQRGRGGVWSGPRHLVCPGGERRCRPVGHAGGPRYVHPADPVADQRGWPGNGARALLRNQHPDGASPAHGRDGLVLPPSVPLPRPARGRGAAGLRGRLRRQGS